MPICGVRRLVVLLLSRARRWRQRPVERVGERVRRAQRLVEIRLAEIREVRLVAAAERVAVLGRRRQDQRVVVAQGVDESARIARRHDDRRGCGCRRRPASPSSSVGVRSVEAQWMEGQREAAVLGPCEVRKRNSTSSSGFIRVPTRFSAWRERRTRGEGVSRIVAGLLTSFTERPRVPNARRRAHPPRRLRAGTRSAPRLPRRRRDTGWVAPAARGSSRPRLRCSRSLGCR